MQVLTSLSGLPISAASAGFSPTNSADVSAIASAYQVVSSTATQLHAGTAYLTSVNDAPISASRAGQAANASLATSAYYDGTGRLISALPDSAAVSAIASSYAESAASGKQDELTFGYDANNLISSIDGSALAGQGGGGGGSVSSPSGTIIVTDGTAIEGTNSAIGPVQLPPVVTASGTAVLNTYATSYGYGTLEYAGKTACCVGITFNSGNEWNLMFSADTEVGYVTGSSHCESGDTSAYIMLSGSPVSIYSTKLSVSGTAWGLSLSGDNPVLYMEYGGTASGVKELAWKDEIPSAVDIGIYEDIYHDKYVSSINSIPVSAKFAGTAKYSYSAGQDPNGRLLTALAANSSVPTGITSPSGTIIANGFTAEATNSAFSTTVTPGYATTVVGWDYQVRPDTPLVCTLPSANSKSQVIVDLDWGTLTSMVSAVYDGITATATANGGGTAEVVLDVPNATRVEVYGSTYRNLIGSASASAADGIAPGTLGELAWASALPTYEYDGDGKISAIDGSALAGGGGGGVDSATVSAIASAYVESGVSSKLDSSASSDFYTTANESGFVDSAYVESSVSGKMDASASSSFYTTANESGFITGVDLTDYATTAYVDSAVSAKMDASAIDYTRTGGGTQIYASGNGSSTNQFSAKNDSAGAAIIAGENARLRLWDTAATANLYASSIGGWNAAANLVSSQSANWGGSALQLSAGAGISLTMSGNILIIATASA